MTTTEWWSANKQKTKICFPADKNAALHNSGIIDNNKKITGEIKAELVKAKLVALNVSNRKQGEMSGFRVSDRQPLCRSHRYLRLFMVTHDSSSGTSGLNGDHHTPQPLQRKSSRPYLSGWGRRGEPRQIIPPVFKHPAEAEGRSRFKFRRKTTNK